MIGVGLEINSTDAYIPLPPPINATSSNSLAGYGTEFQTVLTPLKDYKPL